MKIITSRSAISGVGALIAGAALLGGCAKGGSNNPITAAIQALSDPGLQGAFLSPCISHDVVTGLGHEQKRIEIAGETIKMRTSIGIDSTCQAPTFMLVETGIVKTGDGKGGLKNFDVTVNNVTLQLKSDLKVTATEYNAINFCGVKNWEDGEEHDITTAANDSKLCPFHKTGTIYDVFADQNKGTVLVFGKGNEKGKLDPANRPTELEDKFPFNKQ